jgi:hypothetical protein
MRRLRPRQPAVRRPVPRRRLQRRTAIVNPPLTFRAKLAAKRLLVCTLVKHRRVDITTYQGDRVIVHDCCRRCGKQYGVTTHRRQGPRPAHRHVITKTRAA